MANEALLIATLGAAVPLWIMRLERQPWSYIAQRAPECAQIVAEKGDIIQYRSKKEGESAKAFNALAEGIAICAFFPGGVTFMGLHFEARHPEQKP